MKQFTLFGSRWCWRLEWQPRSTWIGTVWEWEDLEYDSLMLLHVWICILPCVPIHLTYLR